MIKGITRNKHGITDYSYIPITFAAPAVFHFTDEKWASTLCRALSLTVLGYSLLTDARWGAVKLIPYKTHAIIDLSIGVLTLSAPALMPKPLSKRARNTLIAMGITGVVVGILSLIGDRRS